MLYAKEDADKEEDMSLKVEAEDGEEAEHMIPQIPEEGEEFGYMDVPGFESGRNTRLDFDFLQGGK